jgi:hydroxyethylthiazole kinase-like sugar kinase family protein
MNEGTNLEREALREKLIDAAHYGRDAEVALLLQNVDEIDLNTANEEKELALICATGNRHRSIVAQFIACEKADLNVTLPSTGSTAIMIASDNGKKCHRQTISRL